MPSSRLETEHHDEDEYEATELGGIRDALDVEPRNSPVALSSLDRIRYSLKKWFPRRLKVFWNTQISATVAHDLCRSHLGR